MNIISDEKEQLRQQILKAFPKVSPPLATNVTYDYYGESVKARDSFNGVKWWLAECELIDQRYDCLSLLTSEAFHYYLPAFLLCALKRFETNNQTLEFIIYSLSPTKTDADDFWYGDRLKQFTTEQTSIINKFLHHVLSTESMYAFHKDAERGIKKFWDLPKS